jgi:hypothetical protein
VVDEEIDGVVKVLLVLREEPPDAALYQFKVPDVAVACKDTVPEPQRLPLVNEPTPAANKLDTQLEEVPDNVKPESVPLFPFPDQSASVVTPELEPPAEPLLKA